MIFPELIKKEYCNTNIKGKIYSEGIDKFGEPIEYEFSNKCNYQSCCKTIFKDNTKLVQVTGKCFFNGDLIPELSEISSGEVEINGQTRKINLGTKARNLDGTVNFTVLELL